MLIADVGLLRRNAHALDAEVKVVFEQPKSRRHAMVAKNYLADNEMA